MSLISTDLLFTPIPKRIARLRELAYNLWWSWHSEAQDLYRQIDPDLWEQDYHNPVNFLRDVRQQRLEAVLSNQEYLDQYDQVLSSFDQYLNATDTWFAQTYPKVGGEMIAYFSAEFGIHESLPIYSGGLGVLAGDHVKEASDLGLPFVAVGFIYPQGYFRQRLDPSGWQEAIYNKLNFADIAAAPALTSDGCEVVVEVELPGRTIYAKVYRIQVGRVSLLLMDTDIHPNSPQDRELSARLYGGNQEMRVAQEIVLGIGGVRALRQLSMNPTVWHMNEGHSAFLVLELARELVQGGMSFADAAEKVRTHSVFTTHTPVPAGNDAFPVQMIEKYFWQYWPNLGISRDEFMNLALQQQSWGPTFAMTVLALKFSDRHNGVSKLHGSVARGMWQWLYPEKSQDEVPIASITNGIHTFTWIAPEMRRLYDAYLGHDWERHIDNTNLWQKIHEIPDAMLWETHLQSKRRLVASAQTRLRGRLMRLGMETSGVVTLDENALTIGFARRFATYKRATLLFKDSDRLKAILNNPDRPVQFVFAGKAHPADEPGKLFIQQVYQLSQQTGFIGKIIFLEEYDMYIGRELVQGVDLWLNNPRRPNEASGTSGQKASLNGSPNLSILDGWWPEAYNGRNGWVIGEEREFTNYDEQDWYDSQHLYHVLENEVVPAFYNQDADGISQDWVAYMKEAIVTVAPVFSTRRMVKDYVTSLYVPAMGVSTTD
ncbi:MAG: Glucan phosphorylase [Chloroflexi bacterium AL-W]|nr:Glucan phosphorylase [Chloroflexi bacterium AL-N1]NOK65767.1 Glucan phosphorylase [Chloroflexi bacterium AL-N10]NOK74292.1 Glucan phosphorylase [Chloroflexi bacterium AL-N5]NOK80800.1 Glucan phosphorylase [Chloroflexi bacterium AL-W]NOK88550.1 Glucan phosphorylase [Chloroflexi bacterium AL-N15]